MDQKSPPLWTSIFTGGSRSEQKDMLSFLRGSPLFTGLTKRELRTVASIAHHRTYQEGEFIFRKGQPGAAIFIINSGEVNVIDHTEDGGDSVITTLGEGAFFGELALLDDTPRSASVMATTTTEIYAFFRVDLDRLLTSVPQIGLNVYRALAIIIGNRLKSTNAQLFDK